MLVEGETETSATFSEMYQTTPSIVFANSPSGFPQSPPERHVSYEAEVAFRATVAEV